MNLFDLFIQQSPHNIYCLDTGTCLKQAAWKDGRYYTVRVVSSATGKKRVAIFTKYICDYIKGKAAALQVIKIIL